MKLLLLTPAPPGSLAGNRATAERWASLLENLGHQVAVSTDYDPAEADGADMLIALHAWRSHQAVARWRADQGRKPLIVALTGTDLYRYQYSHPQQTHLSMQHADALIVLHHLAWQVVPEDWRERITVVLQSAPEPDTAHEPEETGAFDICVIGHLREEKDPLRAARAVRLVPADSRIRVVQAGKAHDAQWEQAAREEMARNPRYHWRGEIPREQTARLMGQCRAMVISSVMEGGANVVSEACRAGLPVLASDIPGNLGLLGQDYPGAYPVGDEAVLASLMEQAENDPQWLDSLKTITDQLAADFTPEKERASLAEALDRALTFSRAE
ncbi:selenoneine biosynthesis selenosugar synthase SenB [Marinobacter zhanjiangensis]|uniref:Glycosyl transferase family 1 domain-containing protein n=1 Tax=Marinobacter zhanjiangensis TaxID=578215 RepID=A0ABQ3AVM1_9GAMM|nr:selenoneine biosynthesis selenosugar synthase SenB [Marinobacter zhanjiangensis]GGY67440.1 hypothetical protein GCM10007071_13050 [Marinobacter zhanjiangensis]